MSSSGTHRRDQRRRLVVSESLATVVSNPQNAGDVQRTAPYSPQADPDRQRSIASFLPVSRGPFFVACVTSIGLPAILLTAGIFFPEQSAGQFESSITATRAMIDPAQGAPLIEWISGIQILVASLVAISIRGMRRHRLDDYCGRFRAWSWMASLLVVASLNANTSCGRIVGHFLDNVTGITLGPNGLGWWLAVSATALGVISLWAILPLHSRRWSGIWVSCACTAWLGAGVCEWFSQSIAMQSVSQAVWAVGSGLMLIAMLTSARGVILEIRGIATPRAKKESKNSPLPTSTESIPFKENPVDDDPQISEDSTSPFPISDSETMEPEKTRDTSWNDSEETAENDAHPQLSRVERKRLKRLARMKRSA